MKPEERDELLIRLDEKTGHIAMLTERQEEHLRELNKTVSKNLLNIATHNERIKTLETGINVRLSKGQLAVGGGGIATILATLLLTLAKSLGWV